MTDIPDWIQGEIDRVRANNLTELDLSVKPNEQLTPLNYIPPEIFDLNQLEILNLSGHYLQEIPDKFHNFPSLTQLVLKGNFGTLPESIGQLTSLTRLVLRGSFGVLPEWIEELTSLTQLVLRGSFKVLPEWIGELTSVTQLVLRGNFNRIPETIGQLTSLNQLVLWGSFEALPESIEKLTSLTQLALRGNFSALPESIGKLTSLRQLILNGDISSIPHSIGQLTSLTQLDLRGNFNEIPETIGQLTSLTQLVFTGKYINVPNTIKHLKSLIELVLVGDFSRIPVWIGQLTSLTQLDLRGNFNEIPETIGQLKSLTRLVLLGSFDVTPETIGQLKSLTRLVLVGRLKEIPSPIFKLLNLIRLELNDNQISTVEAAILDLPYLTFLDLGGNPIEEPPIEIVKASSNKSVDLEAIRNYYDSIQEVGIDHLYEAKLLIVGEGGAGKTTLANKILNPNYALDSKQQSTEGIEVIEWGFALNNQRHFRVNIWDFGGQEIYHATHQFFLTRRSLYILVADSRKEDTDFNYWLNVVELLGGDSPVLIVKNEKQDRKRQIGEPQLKSRFGNISQILATNLETNRDLDKIRNAIEYYMGELPHVGTPLPKSWVGVRSSLEQDKRNYIPYTDYQAICRDHSIWDASRQNTLIGYLHDLGVCLYFKQDAILRNWVFLNPDWATTAVYKVLDNLDIIENFGRFNLDVLSVVWAHSQYKGMHYELLQLMIRFQLCYKIPDPNIYIAPQLLNENKPHYVWDKTNNLTVRYKYEFMPKGILSRFIVAVHDNIKENLVWKTGVIIDTGDAVAEVEEKYDRSEITIRIVGDDRKSLLSIIMWNIDELHRSYNNLQCDKLVPCNCSVCLDSPKPHYFKFKLLQRGERARKLVQCEKSLEDVDPIPLINDIRSPLATGYEPITHQEVSPMFDDEKRSEVYIENFYTNTPSRFGKQEGNNYIMNQLLPPESESKREIKVPPAWHNGSFYLVLASVIAGIFLFAGNQLRFWNFAIAVVAIIIVITIAGIFQLRQDERVSEEGFTKVALDALSQMNLIGSIVRIFRAPPEQKNTDNQEDLTGES